MWGRAGKKLLPLVVFLLLQISGTFGASAEAVTCCKGVCFNLTETECEQVVPSNACPEEEFGICECFWVPEEDFKSYYCLSDIQEKEDTKGQTVVVAIGIAVGGFCFIMMCCWCLRNYGEYEEEFVDEDTGEITVVRKKSVFEGVHRLKRRASLASFAGSGGGGEAGHIRRLSSVAGRTASSYVPRGARRHSSVTGSGGSNAPRRQSTIRAGVRKTSSITRAFSGLFGGARVRRAGSDVSHGAVQDAQEKVETPAMTPLDSMHEARDGGDSLPVAVGGGRVGSITSGNRVGSISRQGGLVKSVSFRGEAPSSPQARQLNSAAPVVFANQMAQTILGRIPSEESNGPQRVPSDGSNGALPNPVPDSPSHGGQHPTLAPHLGHTGSFGQAHAPPPLPGQGSFYGVVYQSAQLVHPVVPGTPQAAQRAAMHSAVPVSGSRFSA